jgi:hypothetical protein
MTGKDVLILSAAVILGTALGIGFTFLLTAVHILSPDNPVAGTLIGYAGPVFGMLIGLCVIRVREK